MDYIKRYTGIKNENDFIELLDFENLKVTKIKDNLKRYIFKDARGMKCQVSFYISGGEFDSIDVFYGKFQTHIEGKSLDFNIKEDGSLNLNIEFGSLWGTDGYGNSYIEFGTPIRN